MNPMQLARYLIAFLTAVLTTQVYAVSWRSVPGQSQLEFIASYEGAEAPGQFNQFEVVMSGDPVNLAPASLLVYVDITSASMGNADIDEAIAEPEWFNAEAFPHAMFRSEKISTTNDSEYIAEGVVSIKGSDKPVTISFHWRPDGQNAEMIGSLVLSRVDFDIGSGEWEQDSPIGRAVQVRFRITLKAEE